MEKFVPYEKMSKKKKREMDRKKREDWGNVKPGSRVIPDDYKERRDRERIKDLEEVE